MVETFHFTLFFFFQVNLLCHLLNPCNVTFPSKLLPNRLKCYWPDLPFVTSGENLEMFPAKTVLEQTMQFNTRFDEYDDIFWSKFSGPYELVAITVTEKATVDFQ